MALAAAPRVPETRASIVPVFAALESDETHRSRSSMVNAARSVEAVESLPCNGIPRQMPSDTVRYRQIPLKSRRCSKRYRPLRGVTYYLPRLTSTVTHRYMPLYAVSRRYTP